MITAYLWGTPNGYKIAIALEEMELEYTVHWVDISSGAQHAEGFLKLSPNGKIPAIVDHDTGISLMESGAILQYLAQKSGKFGGQTLAEQAEINQWLHWQMGGLGPIVGQVNHFRGLAEKVPYAEKRYFDETLRLFDVLEKRLQGRDYVAGAYSIADMAVAPWAGMSAHLGDQSFDEFENVLAYLTRNVARPGTARALRLTPSR